MNDKHTDINKTAIRSTRIVIVLYVIIKQSLCMLDTNIEPFYWIHRAVACLFMLLLVYIVTRIKLSNRIMPIFVMLSISLPEIIWVSMVQNGEWLFYIFLIGCSLISMLYLDSVGLLLSMILSCAEVALFVFVFGFSLAGSGFIMDDVFGLSGLLLINILIFFICKYSVGAFTQFRRTGKAFDMFMEMSPGYMVVINEKARVEYISQSLAEFFGLSRRQYAYSRALLDLCPGEMKTAIQKAMEAGELTEDGFELTLNGEKHWFILRSSPMQGTKVAHTFEITDVTQIMEVKNAAEAATKAKSNFLARTSHEIRTPMNAIMGMSELILREELPQNIYENATSIKNASMNLLSIINDILDFSKIESGMLKITEENYLFPSLINDVVSVIRMRLLEKPIQFAVCIDSAIPTSLIGDEVRIRQIILNLLSNSVKYTEEGFISLTIAGTLTDDAVMLEITVSDTGMGMKKEDMSKLFEDFSRLDTTKNKGIEGTGLGLAITRNLCRAMGGDITVISDYGIGSEFIVTLSQRYDNYTPCAIVKKPMEKSVLLYETREAYRDSIACTLDILGVRCENAESIASMFERAREYPYLFISAFMYESVKPALLKLDKPPQLILITDVKETIALKGVKTLTMPAYAISIANILNDVKEEHSGVTVTGVSFTAPEAVILVVDDISANLKVAEGLMAPYEMRIDLCGSGQNAIKMVQENQYDLVFMDHMMPEMDGLEATAIIRALKGERYNTLPIIALTANAISGIREMFIQNGMNDFLAKPIEMTKLNAILEKWIPKEKHRVVRISDLKESEDFIIKMRKISWLSADKASLALGGFTAYEKTIRLSVKLLPENVENLETYIVTDLSRYAIEMHGIKGVLNGIGAYSLGDKAYELEILSKNGDDKTCKKCHPSFIDDVKAFINTIIPILGEVEKQQGEMNKIIEVIPAIEQALETYDGLLALELALPLADYSYSQPVDTILKELVNAFEHFDFDKAYDNLQKLKDEFTTV